MTLCLLGFLEFIWIFQNIFPMHNCAPIISSLNGKHLVVSGRNVNKDKIERFIHYYTDYELH